MAVSNILLTPNAHKLLPSNVPCMARSGRTGDLIAFIGRCHADIQPLSDG